MDLRSLRRNVAELAAISSLLVLTSCFNSAGSQYSFQNISISISPQPASIPVNGTATFTAAVANTPDNPEWVLESYSYANLGSPSVFFGPTYVYTAPATPPIYTGAGSFGNVQGTVTVQATVFGDDFNGFSATDTFVITAPSVTAGITPQTATVPLNSTLQLNAYAVGNINNAVTVEVNGVAGGSVATGTIAHTASQFPGFYLYTAPAVMPMTGSTVTITVVSQADPTKTASSVLTLQ